MPSRGSQSDLRKAVHRKATLNDGLMMNPAISNRNPADAVCTELEESTPNWASN